MEIKERKEKNGDETIEFDKKTGIITISAESITFNPEVDQSKRQEA